MPDTALLHETAARRELAACYRLFHHLGWTEGIFNHITLRVDGDAAKPHYLINPFGLHYSEVTADNLLKIDVDGEVIGRSDHPVNRAGFVIHGAIHAVRPDAHCVMHVHTTAGVAVACKASGLRHDNFYSAMLWGQIGYHEFEGITTGLDERPRLVASLGTHDYLILRKPRPAGGGRNRGRRLPEAVDPAARLRDPARQRRRAGPQPPGARRGARAHPRHAPGHEGGPARQLAAAVRRHAAPGRHPTRGALTVGPGAAGG